MIKTIYWYFPHLQFWMGGTKFLFEVTRRLSKNYSVTLVCNTGKTEVINRFRENRVNVVIISKYSTNSILYWILLPIFMCYDYYRCIAHFRNADYIVATSFPANFICAIFSKFNNKPYTHYCYEPFAFFHNKSFINSFPLLKRLLLMLLSLMYSSLDIWATQKAASVITLNETTQNMIKNTYKKKSIISLMGVDSNHFKYYSTNKIKEKYKSRIIITHSTDYTFMKRTDLAITAISHLIKKYPDILLIITSTQPDSTEKEKYVKLVKQLGINNNILFLGLVPYNDLPLYYSASLCYLSCSYDEMFGTTSSNLPVKEALACETACIRANITSEDVEDGVSGFLVDPINTVIVADKIEYFIKNPKKAREMGKTGRKKIVHLYTWEHAAKVIEENLV